MSTFLWSDHKEMSLHYFETTLDDFMEITSHSEAAHRFARSAYMFTQSERIFLVISSCMLPIAYQFTLMNVFAFERSYVGPLTLIEALQINDIASIL